MAGSGSWKSSFARVRVKGDKKLAGAGELVYPQNARPHGAAATSPGTPGPSMSLIWLRHEYKSDERRAPITPEQVGVLVAAGHEVTVESSSGRVFPDHAYRAQGAEIVPPGTWHDAPGRAFILGIKEVLQEEITAHNLALKHRHIYFAHVFKGQSLTPVTMRRFALGQGTLLDLEYLVDAEGRRVATFSYSAGFAGAIAAVHLWADKQMGTLPPYALPRHSLSRAEFIDELRRKLARAGRRPTALVIGANGRSGRGAAALFEALGIAPVRWGRAETAAGGPFPALLDHDIVCNCVFLEKPVPPFLTRDMVAGRAAGHRLSVVADVSNDLSFNPVFGISNSTKFSDAAVRVGDVDVIEIENLPALTPLDSSLEYSEQLFPHLRELIAGELPPGSVWEKTLLTYFQHHDIPQLAMECGRELGEQFLADPGACSVESLRTYFSNLFAKNPLSRTDRLYFVDHLTTGASEVLSDSARETFAARLAKVELDHVYDSPAMEAHHALLAAVYGFSRNPAFPRVVAADARDDFYDLCDAVSTHIDQRASPAEDYAQIKERFLRKLGPRAGDPLLAGFFLEIQSWVILPPPAI